MTSEHQLFCCLFAVPVIHAFLCTVVLLQLLLLPHFLPPLFHLTSIGKLFLATLFLLPGLAEVAKCAVDTIGAANGVHERTRLATARAMTH